MYSGSPRQMNPFEILVCSLSGDETYSNPCIVSRLFNEVIIEKSAIREIALFICLKG